MNQAAVESRLRKATRFDRLLCVRSCASTQDLAAETEPAGNLIACSEEQTSGRGRLGRDWDTRPGKDLAMTMRIEEEIDQQGRLAAALPSAILAALEKCSGLRLTLKWPNDLQFKGRKICGILIDATSQPRQRLLIGVGVNVNRSNFPQELQESASSLALATGEEFDRSELLLAIAAEVDAALQALKAGAARELVTLFADRLGCLGRNVRLRGDQLDVSGRVEDLDFEHLVLSDGQRYPLAHLQSLSLR
ncbi:MAG: biotin--[acetyl-CoA-carboxylase] ligase [Planctomycetota bacterium]|jgi:BirA family biotin operon repressor/biotin-[acetyl-CoA-carboxylase] ligase